MGVNCGVCYLRSNQRLFIKADEIFIGIMTLILGLFGDYCLWIFGNLLFSYLKDIKFIRNKLYNLDECNIDLMKEEESSEKTVKSDDTKNSEQTIETK